MIGCIKAISPCVKSVSAKLFLDLHTVLAPSGEERTLNRECSRTEVVVERAGRCCRRFDSDTQTLLPCYTPVLSTEARAEGGKNQGCTQTHRCGSVTVMVLVSSARPPSTQGRAFERLHSRSAVL